MWRGRWMRYTDRDTHPHSYHLAFTVTLPPLHKQMLMFIWNIFISKLIPIINSTKKIKYKIFPMKSMLLLNQ